MLRAMLMFVTIAIPLNATAGIISQWEVADGGNGNWYQQVVLTDDTILDWAMAKEAAESMTFMGATGHLVTISSAEEQLFIEDLYDGNKSWIGLTDDPAFGGTESFGQPNPQVDGWVWVTGEPVVYTHWDTAGTPNNQHGNENFVMMFIDSLPGGWEDATSSPTAGALPRYLVEFEASEIHNVPEPSSLVLTTSMLAVVAAWRGIRRKRKAA